MAPWSDPQPVIEPGPHWWEADMLPISHRLSTHAPFVFNCHSKSSCFDSATISKATVYRSNLKRNIRHISPNDINPVNSPFTHNSLICYDEGLMLKSISYHFLFTAPNIYIYTWIIVVDKTQYFNFLWVLNHWLVNWSYSYVAKFKISANEILSEMSPYTQCH